MTEHTFRRFFFAQLTLLATLFALPSRAAPLDFAVLPAGDAPAPPARSSAPFAISGAQVAPGLHRVAPERILHRKLQGYYEFVVFDDAARARAFETALTSGVERAKFAPNTCFATPGNFRVPEPHDAQPLEWDTFSADRFTAQSFPSDGSRWVVPVRAERWVEAGAKLRIETTLFWIDTRTGGTRLITRSVSEPARVATPFAGVSVYALRTGGDSVSFFVRRDAPRSASVAPGASAQEEVPEGLLGRLLLARSRGNFEINLLRTTVEGDTHTSPCAFERVDLKSRTEPAPGAEFAAASSAKASAQKTKGFDSFRNAPRSREIANVAFAVVFDLVEEPPLEPTEVYEKSEPEPERHGTARVRTLLVNLGLARSASGTAPIPSVSYRWLDRLQKLAF